MRIKAITPIRVSDAELVRRAARYRELAPAGIQIELVNLPDGEDVPRCLDNADDIAASDRLVADEARRTDPARHDAVVPDCVLDPGVLAAADDAPVPVHGILRLSAGLLASLGQRFAAVTRNAPIGNELVACLERYGLADRFDELAVLDLTFEDIEDDATWNAAIDRVRGRFADRGVPFVINGCSAVEVHPRDRGTAVVDPTQLALRLLGVVAASGLGGRSRAALLS